MIRAIVGICSFNTSVLALALLSACTPIPWGEGAVDLPLSSARSVTGIERHVPESALAAVAAALTTATIGTPMRLVGAGDSAGIFFDREIPITSFDLKTNGRGLVLIARVPPTDVVWWQNPTDPTQQELGCSGTLTLGPGTYSVALDFATDKLGRITTLPADRAEWDGPFSHVPAADNGSECKDVQGLDLAGLLSRRVPATIAAHEGGAIARALGFALATRLGGTAPFSPGQVRAHLRAREEQPVVPRDGGLSAYFELQVQAETAPCLAPWSFTPGRPDTVVDHTFTSAGAYSDAGLFIPRAAIAASLEALTVAGGLCGSLERLSAPLDRVTVAQLVPSWAGELRGGEVGQVALEWQPHGPPDVTIDDDDRLHWTFNRIDVAVYGAWGGATWRLGGLSATLDVSVAFEVHRDGAISATVMDVELTDTASDAGLLATPMAGELEALIAFVVSDLLDGREFIRLPAELAPTAPMDLLVIGEADGLLVPTR